MSTNRHLAHLRGRDGFRGWLTLYEERRREVNRRGLNRYFACPHCRREVLFPNVIGIADVANERAVRLWRIVFWCSCSDTKPAKVDYQPNETALARLTWPMTVLLPYTAAHVREELTLALPDEAQAEVDRFHDECEWLEGVDDFLRRCGDT